MTALLNIENRIIMNKEEATERRKKKEVNP